MNGRVAAALTIFVTVPLQAQDHSHHDHAHEAGVDSRGDEGMGFSHDKVAHHFGLTRSGGFITAEVKDPADAASASDVREHFNHIAVAFKRGDFNLPMFIHGRAPPGVPVMKTLKSEINYDLQDTALGGRIAITTTNPKAIDAIHRFLRFQIQDHRTGDSTEIQP
ncbi:MAG: hypothetical protein E6J61_18025 [Deltaproteobacteria bacterium]|nr:MAG: hypothetical protein E6J61_18025 [Deltaproteobacteria bacterium]